MTPTYLSNPVVPSPGSPPWAPPHSSVGLSLCSYSIDQICITVRYKSQETWLFPSLHWECLKNRDHDLFIFTHQVPEARYFTIHSTKYTWQVFQYFSKYFLKKYFILTLASQTSLSPCSLTLNLFSATSSPLRLCLWGHLWVESLVLHLHSLPSLEQLLYDAPNLGILLPWSLEHFTLLFLFLPQIFFLLCCFPCPHSLPLPP